MTIHDKGVSTISSKPGVIDTPYSVGYALLADRV